MGSSKSLARADDDEELLKKVGIVLNSSEVVSVAQSLIARSNEARTPVHFVRYLKTLSVAERHVAIQEKITATYHEILNSLAFANMIASTNASGWGVDECQIEEFEMSDEKCTVSLSYSASGDQDKEKPYSGDTVVGTAVAVIDSHGDVQYTDITAEVTYEPDESDSSDTSGAAP